MPLHQLNLMMTKKIFWQFHVLYIFFKLAMLKPTFKQQSFRFKHDDVEWTHNAIVKSQLKK